MHIPMAATQRTDTPFVLPILLPPQSRQAGPSALSGEVHALRWVFGNVASAALEDFAARQRELRAGRCRADAVADMYEDMAYHWRQLQAFLDKRARLEGQRRNTKVRTSRMCMCVAGWRPSEAMAVCGQRALGNVEQRPCASNRPVLVPLDANACAPLRECSADRGSALPLSSFAVCARRDTSYKRIMLSPPRPRRPSSPT